MKQPRAVLDTNCLVSALVFRHSRLSALRHYWKANTFVPLGCKETVSELIRVLAYRKFKLTRQEIEAILEDILPFLETHVLLEAYTPIAGLRDAQDAMFFHLAHQAKADMLVSGDDDILAMQGAAWAFRILSPAEFVDSLR
jgi:putative PIN family toxin of toxin-antitoxin system